MINLDLRTLLICFNSLYIVSTIIHFWIWYTNKHRFSGLLHWAIYFLLISFGITSLSMEEDMGSILHRADQALYKAKNSGRNCAEFL